MRSCPDWKPGHDFPRLDSNTKPTGSEKFPSQTFLVVRSVFTIRNMYHTDSLLTFSFPMGRLCGAPLRFSFLMPVVALAVMWRMQDLLVGGVCSVLLLISLLIHECAHILVSGQLKVPHRTVVIWPLGGMQSVRPRMSFRDSVLVTFSGPLCSALIAGACGWYLYREDLLFSLLNPFGPFQMHPSHPLLLNCIRVLFVINFCLALFNLIPVRPFDAGHVLESFLSLRFAEIETRDVLMRIGLVFSLFSILAGFVFDISGLVALGAFLLVLHIHEVSQWTPFPEPVDSGNEYNFSGDAPELTVTREFDSDVSNEPDPEPDDYDILEQWKSRRNDERLIREAETRQLDERRLDQILEKLHSQGRESLTERELRILVRVSAQLRQRHVREQ